MHTSYYIISPAYPTRAQSIQSDGRLSGAERVTDSFYAVSQVSLDPKSAFANEICMTGDTAGMIAPLCGDGMAMALSSAELAAPFVDKVLRGERSAESVRQDDSRAWNNTFG